MADKSRKRGRLSHLLFLIYLVLAAGIVGAGYFYYRNFEKTIFLVGALLLGAGVGVGLIWWQQRLRFYRARTQAHSAQTLRESEERYRILFDEALDGICLADSETGLILDCNRALAALVGRERAELIGQSQKILHSASNAQEAFSPTFKQHLTEKEGQVLETQVVTGAGLIRDVEIKANYLNLQGRKVLHGVFRDITERKRAEEALRESESKFKRLYDSNIIGVIFWDTAGNIIQANGEFLRTVGYTEDDVLSGRARWKDMTPPEYAYLDEKAIKEMTETGISAPFEKEYIRKDGSRVAIRLNAALLKGEGDVGVCFIQDITERKRAEEALAVQIRIADVFLAVSDDEMFDEILKIILEVMQSPHGVFGYIDEAGALVVPSMTRHIWDKCRIPDKTLTFPRDTWGDSSWPRAVREKKPNYTNEISAKTPKGHIGLRRHISLPILFRGGVIGLFQVANKETDYTEADIRTLETIAGYVSPVLSAWLHRRRHEEEMQKRNDELTRFTYAVSHDLKSPLVTINTFLGYLEQDARKPDAAGVDKDLGYIRSASDKMSRLLDELLELSRVGRIMNPSVEVPLQEIVKEALDLVAGRIAARGVKVKVIGKPVLLYGDRPRLVEIFQNLVDNAVKFMGGQPAPSVEIGAEQADTETVFFVRDNGIGIDPRYLPKLFGLFEKLDPGTEGTGIGLALVKRIVEVHGGRIWVESAGPGQGATFRFTLAKAQRQFA